MLQHIKYAVKGFEKKVDCSGKKGSFGERLETQVSKGVFKYEKDLQVLMFWGICDSQREIYNNYKHYKRFFSF